MTTVAQKRSLFGAVFDTGKRHFRKSPAIFSFAVLLVVLTAIYAAIGALSGLFKSSILTTTVTAETEAFQFRTPEGRETSWSMPPGKFSILGATASKSCDVRGFEAACQVRTNTRLVVDGIAEISMQASPVGGWTLSVSETEDAAADIRLYDVSGELLLQSDQLLDYHSSSFAKAIRFPFVANSASVGADLFQSMTIDDTIYDLWKPVLLSGNVTMIADNRPGRETYKVLDERLDPGDVLHLGDFNSSTDTDSQIGVWGLVTVTADAPSADAADFKGAGVLKVVLHTSFREVWVTRFGAPDGHVIRASKWTLQQQWPNGQRAWFVLVTLFVFAGFISKVNDIFHKTFDADDPDGQQMEPANDSSSANNKAAASNPSDAKNSPKGDA